LGPREYSKLFDITVIFRVDKAEELLRVFRKEKENW